MAAAVENDIEEFIRNQKAKLQQERQYLSEEERSDKRGRRQWGRPTETHYANERESPGGLPLTNEKAKSKQQQLREERKREYNELLNRKQNKTNSKAPENNKEQIIDIPTEKDNDPTHQNGTDSNNNTQQHQTGGLQQQSPRKPDLDYNEIERKFQEQKRREFNEYVNRPKFKKAPTPPQSGMKFGEYEDFRKRVEQQRKEEYRSELEKQTLEQAMIRAQGDIPRIGTKPNISQEELNNIAQEKQRRDLRDKMVEDKRIREFERMLHMSHHDERLTDYMEQERNRIIEDYPLREQDILAMFQRQIEEKERRKQNEARERELEKKQLEFERKLDQNYSQDRNDFGFQGRNAARSEPPPPGRRGDQYDAPRQQSEYAPPRRGARSPPRQDYSPRQEEREGFTERLHKIYEDERRQDYQNHVQQSESDPPFSHRLGGYETHRNKLKTQRILETQQHMEERNAQATNRSWNEPEDTESGLPLGNDFNHKQKMEVQRNREYNEFLKKKYDKNRAPAGKQRGSTLSLGQYEDEKKRLQQERQREYRELMDKRVYYHSMKRKDKNKLPSLRNNAKIRQHPLVVYREQVNELLKSLDEIEENEVPENVLREYIKKIKQKKNLIEENYRLQQQKEQERNRGRRGEPTRSKSPDNFFSGFGKHDEERNKLNVERKKEYNHMLAEELPRRGRPRDPPQEREDTPPREPEIYEASLHGLRQHDSAEVRKKQTRNDEYNDFLKQNREKEKHKYDKQKYGESNPRGIRDRPSSEPQPTDGIYATLPGLHYNGSAEKRKIDVRNKEYNEFLRNSQENLSRRRGGNRPPPGPRRGWQSPGNDDGRDRRRREEPAYRQDDRDRRLKSYNSDGAINRAGNDRRYDDDDDDDRRGRYRSDRNRDKGILDDDNWLSARREPEDEYQNLEPNPPRQRGRAPPNRSPPPDKEDMARANYFATLPVGGNDRESANARKKARYREELQLQMREAEAARRREKVEELRVNASGLLDPEKTPKRLTYLGEPNPSPRRNLKSPEVRPYHTRFDLSPRGQGIEPESSGGYTPRERGRTRERRPRERSGGILDIGFDGLLDQPRRGGASQVPPGLQYQPSLLDFSSLDRFADPNIERTRTYVTGGGSGGLNQPYSSIDEAYHYYGMKNPLEPDNRKRNPNGAPPPLDLGGGGGGGYDRPYRGSPRVTFDDSSKKYGILKDERYEKKDEIVQTFDQKDETVQTIEITVPPPPTTARARDRSKERISPYQFPSDDDLRSRSQNDKRSYQEELDRQIQEKRYRKQREKEEQERYEKKLDDEIRNYNPFGKGGGGAPLRDNQGNIVADLRAMHQDPETARSTARATHESPRFRAPSSPRDDLIAPPPDQIDASGDVTHARGGHGIFGQPKTEQEKTQSDRYKDELRRQIEEKKRREQIEKEKERIEEEKENRRLEEQRLRIQKEYEEEQRKKREKEEETRRRNEELQQQAEAKKKEAKRKRQEEDERRTQEKRDQQERERQERQEPRGSSPPVPAVRTATEQKPDYAEGTSLSIDLARPSHFRSNSVRLGIDSPDNLNLKKSYGISTSEDTRKSPPIPALRREPSPLVESSRPPPQPPSRANSSDVLKELASMRKQLQSERKRVENALETQRNEPDVFDPRMVQRPAPKEIDVFERARQGEPAPVRTENLNPRNIQEFNELKYKNDTESRKAFRSMFPDAPTSSETLEAQQDALLRHQEDTLKSMKETITVEDKCNKCGREGVAVIDKKAKDRDLFSGLGAPPLTTRQGTVSPRSMLNSNSAFIDVDGLNHFPDDFEDLPKRNESARYRRRERVTLSPRVDSVGYNPPESQPLNPFGSTASLDVDRIQRKNDARLRRLHQLNADEVSLADPDDILDRFMAKQRYNRPPSGQTLQDDTWLRPASKAI
ncbi:centrosome and spindle pole associated protein 1-like isoform X9 [Crassostrea angulata]|uniref:centrosome and spindle pole associated protein 1-like isoform X9 n=1 Tax=Magallana angulata TaxID=2784310 RepID=UPI0022B11DA9|nr:centrosome and spindle pole associated protein 1-like isoform X9 [Crassostrea angulata]